jgi:hypothetical protein
MTKTGLLCPLCLGSLYILRPAPQGRTTRSRCPYPVHDQSEFKLPKQEPVKLEA